MLSMENVWNQVVIYTHLLWLGQILWKQDRHFGLIHSISFLSMVCAILGSIICLCSIGKYIFWCPSIVITELLMLIFENEKCSFGSNAT